MLHRCFRFEVLYCFPTGKRGQLSLPVVSAYRFVTEIQADPNQPKEKHWSRVHSLKVTPLSSTAQ